MRKTAGMRRAEKAMAIFARNRSWDNSGLFSFFFLRFITQMKASKNRNMFGQCVKRSRN